MAESTPSTASTAGPLDFKNPCYVCGTLTSKGCRDCGKVYYCSSRHAAEDRPRHIFECQTFDQIARQWLIDTAPVKPKSASHASSRKPVPKSTTSKSASLRRSMKSKDTTTESHKSAILILTSSSTYMPLSKPSAKSKSKSKLKQTAKRQTIKDKRIEIKAFFFPANEEEPQLVPVKCSVLHSSFEDTYHRVHYRSLLGDEASFNSIPTHRGLFLLLRQSDAQIEDFQLQTNRCIMRLSDGATPNWRGSALVLKEMLPKTGIFRDVEQGDLEVLSMYFKLDGNTPLDSLTRALFLSNIFSLVEPSTSTQPTVDAIVFPAATPVPYLIPLPYSPVTGRPHRPEYTTILGPDPIFTHIVTYAGDFMVGCRPRYGYEGENDVWNAEEEDDEDVNMAVMCMTRRQGGWRRWPHANILVLKMQGTYLGKEEGGTGKQVYRDATAFDVAPLVRYFELSGTMSDRELERALANP